MRLVVHHGHAGGAGAAQHLREVAEAFTDCQAVQARTVERVGLLLRGVALDFRGHLVRLVGEYKAMAVKILAVEACTRLGGPDDYNDPAHYENRLFFDLGDRLGLNKAHIRQASVDTHASQRFPRLSGAALRSAEARLREHFDVEALLKAFAAEASTFGVESGRDSLPRLFLDFASERLTQQHVVLDEDTCTNVEVGEVLALAVFEAVFLGKPGGPSDESYRDILVRDLIRPDEAVVAEVAAEEEHWQKEEEKEDCASVPVSRTEKEDDGDEDDGDEDDAADEDGESETSENNNNVQTGPSRWEVNLDSHWATFEEAAAKAVAEAEAEGRTCCEYFSRGFLYTVDLEGMVQTNVQTGKTREVRCRQVP